MILKRKSRYVLVRSSESINMDSKDTIIKFCTSIEKIMGVRNYSSSHLRIAKVIDEKHFIVKMDRGQEAHFTLATSFIKQVNGTSTGLQTIKTSGAINNLIRLSKTLQ